MSRLLLLVLAACGAATPPAAHVETEISLDAWLERLAQARGCLVAPAPDLETGVIIALQRGNDCRRHVHRLAVVVAKTTAAQDQLLMTSLTLARRAEAETFSPSKRASFIGDLDKTVETLLDLVAYEREATQPTP